MSAEKVDNFTSDFTTDTESSSPSSSSGSLRNMNTKEPETESKVKRSPGQLQDIPNDKIGHSMRTNQDSSAADNGVKDENVHRAKRKRYSYPLLGSYEKEIPGIHRLPLSPVKSKQSSVDGPGPSTFQKPNTVGGRPVKAAHPLVRRASASFADTHSPLDVYDPRNAFLESIEPPNTFNFQQNRIIRRQRKKGTNDFFSVLPDEMVLKVFGLLGKGALFNCLLVSQRFNELGNDEALWKRVDVLGKFLTPESSKNIFRRKPTHIRFARSLVPAPVSVNEKFTAAQLLYLDLSMAEITTTDLARILSTCTSLLKCSLESLCVTSEVIEAMMSFSTTIDTLNLTLCYDVNFKAFSKFIVKCRKLKSLNIGCIVQTWTKEELKTIANTLPVSLERLNIAGFVYRMTDEHVKIFANRLVRLKEFDLSDSQEITHKSVQYIVENLKVLENLSLSRCYSIRIGAYILLPTAPRLRYVQLYSIFKDHTMSELQATLKNIKFNTEHFSTVARPTVGFSRSSIWGERVRD